MGNSDFPTVRPVTLRSLQCAAFGAAHCLKLIEVILPWLRDIFALNCRLEAAGQAACRCVCVCQCTQCGVYC